MLLEFYSLELQLSNNSDSTLNKVQKCEADYKKKKIQQNVSKELYATKTVAEKRRRRYGNFGPRGPANYTPNQ